jgi:hypothetical protein
MTTEERIAKLEAQLDARQTATVGEHARNVSGRGKMVPIICIVGFIGFFMGLMFADEVARATDAAKDQDVLSVEALQIVDGEGRKRIVLDVSNGEARIRVFDEEGKARVKMIASDRQAGVVFQDGDEVPRATLGAVDEHGPALALVDNSGLGGIMLHALHNRPHLDMKGENGQGRIMLALTEHGPMLNLYDGEGSSLWSVPRKGE